MRGLNDYQYDSSLFRAQIGVLCRTIVAPRCEPSDCCCHTGFLLGMVVHVTSDPLPGGGSRAELRQRDLVRLAHHHATPRLHGLSLLALAGRMGKQGCNAWQSDKQAPWQAGGAAADASNSSSVVVLGWLLEDQKGCHQDGQRVPAVYTDAPASERSTSCSDCQLARSRWRRHGGLHAWLAEGAVCLPQSGWAQEAPSGTPQHQESTMVALPKQPQSQLSRSEEAIPKGYGRLR